MGQASSGAASAMRPPGRRFGGRKRLGWTAMRGWCGAGLAALLLAASAMPAFAQAAAAASDPADTKPAKAAAKPASSKAAKSIAQAPEPGKKVATKKSDAKKVAEAGKKAPGSKKTVAAAKKSTPARIVEPATAAVAARKPPQTASYTITTTIPGNASYTETRVVPLTPARANPTTAFSVSTPSAPKGEATASATPANSPPNAAAPAAVQTAAAAASPPAQRVLPPAQPAAAPSSPALAPPRSAAQLAAVQPAAAPKIDKAVAPPAPAKAAVVPVSLTPAATPANLQLARPAPVRAAPQPAVGTQTGPADLATAAGVVDNFLREAFRIAKAGGSSSLQRRAQLADLFTRKLDIGRIAGYTTGDELAAMPPEIQQRFRAVLISYLVETYYPRIEMAAEPSVTVEITPLTVLGDGTAVVTTSFTKSGWETQSVKWELAAERDGYRIVDIFSAGASLVQMERDTFLSVMRNGGVPELMAKLDARTKALASAATQ